MRRLFKVVAILTLFLIIDSCEKDSLNKDVVINNKRTSYIEDDYSKTEDQLRKHQQKLLQLNIDLWSRLASNPIEEVQQVCINRDTSKLIKLLGLSDISLTSQIEESITCAKVILGDDYDNDACNCNSQIDFNEIYNFVLKIQNEGGAEVFFAKYLDLYLAPDVPIDGEQLAVCLATCHITCMTLLYYPPAYTACMVACTALCYGTSTH